MRNKKSVLIVIVIIAILGISIYFFMQHGRQKNKDYNIEKITDYKYFVSKNSENQKFGVIDTSGKVIVPEEYTDVIIPNPSKAVFICNNETNTIALNETAEKIYTEYNNIETLRLKNVSSDLIYEKSVLKYEKDGKFGLINIEGKQLTQAIYEEIDTLQYKEGELLVKQEGKYGVINLNGYIIIEPKYDEINADTFYEEETQYRYDGYIVSNKTDTGYRYGYLSYTGEQYLDTIYNDLKRVTEIGTKDEAYLLVAENGRYGIIKNNKQLIENTYQSISFENSNRVFIAQKGKKYGAFDENGKQILNCEFEQLEAKGIYLYATKQDNNVEVYSNKGELVNIDSNTVIVDIPEHNNYTIHIKTNDKNTTYQIYQNDTPITTEEYRYIEYLENDLFIGAKTGEKLGVISIKGEPKTEFNYESIQVIPDTELIEMKTVDKGAIEIADKNANTIVKMEKATIYKDKYICLSDGTNKKYVTLEGKEISNEEANSSKKLFEVSQGDKWGFADKSGNIKVEAIYDKVTSFNKYGFAGISKDDKWGVINEEGAVIIEPTYTDIPTQKEPDFIGIYYQVEYGSGQIYYAR